MSPSVMPASPSRRSRWLRRAPAAAVVLAVVVAAGCSGAGSDGSAGATPSGRPSQALPDVATVPPSAAPVTGEVPQAIVDEARALLAEQVGADTAAAAALVRDEAVTWPDGSLGCPEPGMFYTQALVDGYHLVFEVDGRSYDFRATAAGEVRACTLGGPRG